MTVARCTDEKQDPKHTNIGKVSSRLLRYEYEEHNYRQRTVRPHA